MTRAAEACASARVSLGAGYMRLVADVWAERRRGALLRGLPDAGSLVSVALLGAAVAIYASPPLPFPLALGAAEWLVALVLLTRHVLRRASGRGAMGSAEANVAYWADPERYAVGGVYSLALGTGLGAGAMLLALAARGHWP